jgi:biopolymer transport protein ExbD
MRRATPKREWRPLNQNESVMQKFRMIAIAIATVVTLTATMAVSVSPAAAPRDPPVQQEQSSVAVSEQGKLAAGQDANKDLRELGSVLEHFSFNRPPAGSRCK